MLESNMHFLSSKYFKRVLVSYVEKCSSSELPNIYKALDMKSKILECLQDKYLAYIFLMFIQRGYQEAINSISQAITRVPLEVFSLKYSGFLFSKLVERKNSVDF